MMQDNHSSEPAELHEEPTASADATELPPAPAPAPVRKTAPRAPPRRPPATESETARLQPSWLLSASGEQLTREELLARYRRQRALPEGPFENETRGEPLHGYPGSIMNERQAARFRERPHQPPSPQSRTPRNFTVMQTFAIAAATALVAGGSAGVLSAHIVSLQASGPAIADADADVTEAAPVQLATQLQTTRPDAVRDTIIQKKPVSTATLQVADVAGETNSFIPLALHAVPAGLDTDMLLKISGLPEGAYLTSGHRQDDQIWTLSLAETKGVKLVVPQADDPQIDLAVAAFEPRTGELAAPVKTMTVALKDVVVEPASAPPPNVSTVSPTGANSTLPGAGNTAPPTTIASPFSAKLALAEPETAETRKLIDIADVLLGRGDVAGARRSFERAWGKDGSAAAAFGLARSYDPLLLPTLPAANAAPDKSQAMLWYQRAAAAGNAEAAKAIILLQKN